jgi:hypothetical protein
MTKRILLMFVVLAAMLLPATAATKAHAHRKHSVARSRRAKSKAKSVRKSTHRRTRSAAARRRAIRARAAARRHHKR